MKDKKTATAPTNPALELLKKETNWMLRKTRESREATAKTLNDLAK